MDFQKKRIAKEYDELSKNQVENSIDVWLVDNNIKHWKAKINGPVKNNKIF